MRHDVMQIPNGSSGAWKVETFTVTNEDLFIENLHAMFKPGGRMMKAGTYKRLTRNGSVIMSNTSAEIRDHLNFVYRAKGNVLINGLGLGCVLADVLNKDCVDSVTVIEISPDVISLVAPYFSVDPRLKIINADAYNYKPPKGVRFNAVWHDIWDNICSDNLLWMEKLHRKYGKKTDYQDSWCKHLCQRYR